MSYREQDAYMPTVPCPVCRPLAEKNAALPFREVTHRQGWSGVDAPPSTQTECADKPDTMLADIGAAVHNLEAAKSDGQKLLHEDAAIGRAIYSMPYGATFHRNDPACGGPEWYIQHFKHTGAVAYATAEETLERAGEIFTKPLAPRLSYVSPSDVLRLQADNTRLRSQLQDAQQSRAGWVAHAEKVDAENAGLRREVTDAKRQLALRAGELATSMARIEATEADKAEILRQLEKARHKNAELLSMAKRYAHELTECYAKIYAP